MFFSALLLLSSVAAMRPAQFSSGVPSVSSAPSDAELQPGSWRADQTLLLERAEQILFPSGEAAQTPPESPETVGRKLLALHELLVYHHGGVSSKRGLDLACASSVHAAIKKILLKLHPDKQSPDADTQARATRVKLFLDHITDFLGNKATNEHAAFAAATAEIDRLFMERLVQHSSENVLQLTGLVRTNIAAWDGFPVRVVGFNPEKGTIRVEPAPAVGDEIPATGPVFISKRYFGLLREMGAKERGEELLDIIDLEELGEHRRSTAVGVGYAIHTFDDRSKLCELCGDREPAIFEVRRSWSRGLNGVSRLSSTRTLNIKLTPSKKKKLPIMLIPLY